ncbi:porin [Psychromonas marina]|uniref:Porin n=1 Tax=Psychromonas marina TaxID=88364 RepID=A0ABQ6E4E1_9GAMM|nr:porin [Psychromonas marina]GLS92261.1 porin [Psychromonas marina]
MKKTILALAVTGLFATTAQAATIYEADGVQVNVYGDIEVGFLNTTSEDTDVVIHIDDADFGFGLGYDLGNGYTVGGVLEFSGEDGDVSLGDTFVGIKSDRTGTLTIGKQATIYDDAGIGNDYQFGFQNFYEQDKNSGFQVIKYKIDHGNVYGGIAYLMNTELEETTNEYAVDANFGFRVADFDFTVFYGQAEVTKVPNNTTDGLPTNTVSNYTVEGRYQLDALALALTVAGTDNGSDDNSLSYGGSFAYAAENNVGFGAGIAYSDMEATTGEGILGYYVNLSYEFTSKVNTYIEVGGNDMDDTEVGYAAGVQVAF